jgi:hypothetical protein
MEPYIAESNKMLADMYKKHPVLRPTEEGAVLQQQAALFQQRANEIEQAKYDQFMIELMAKKENKLVELRKVLMEKLEM